MGAEEEKVLRVIPVKELQLREKQTLLRTLTFMRRNAPVIKKKLLLASLNHSFNHRDESHIENMTQIE